MITGTDRAEDRRARASLPGVSKCVEHFAVGRSQFPSLYVVDKHGALRSKERAGCEGLAVTDLAEQVVARRTRYNCTENTSPKAPITEQKPNSREPGCSMAISSLSA